MYDIKIKVNGNGTLTTGKSGRLRLGTKSEIGRACLVFDVDSTVEGTYQYVKFVKDTTSYLYRVTSKTHILNKSILSDAGIWFISFISSKEGISNNKLSGSYAYISEPIEAVVIEGIFEKGRTTEEAKALNDICSMNFSDLVIPESVTSIGDYFMYETGKTFNLHVGDGVKSIGKYAFYHADIPSLKFGDGSCLEELGEYSLYSIDFQEDIVLPNTIRSWGKYVFSKSSGKKVSFKKGCNLDSMGSYAFWLTKFTELELPDGLKTLSGNTYVIKDNTELTRIWIPKSITTAIPANAIFGNGSLTTIELEEGFNCSANFINCTYLTAECMEKMFYALKNLNGTTAKSLTLGGDNLAKLNESQIAIATNKNWTLS